MPKKITEIEYRTSGNYTYIEEYVFENNILKSITSGNNRYDFVFNGDKVTQANRFVNGVASGTSIYNYIGDKLNYNINSDQDQKVEFAYSGNVLNKITQKLINGSNETILEINDVIINTSGNLTQKINTRNFAGTTYVTRTTYTHDTKNSPLTNLNKYMKLIYESGGISGLNTNNFISTNVYPVGSTTPTTEYSYQYSYNSNNYPTRIIKTKVSDNSTASNTTIEYY